MLLCLQAAPGEERNIVVSPVFQGSTTDHALRALADILLLLEGSHKIFSTEVDLRDLSAEIQERLDQAVAAQD